MEACLSSLVALSSGITDARGLRHAVKVLLESSPVPTASILPHLAAGTAPVCPVVLLVAEAALEGPAGLPPTLAPKVWSAVLKPAVEREPPVEFALSTAALFVRAATAGAASWVADSLAMELLEAVRTGEGVPLQVAAALLAEAVAGGVAVGESLEACVGVLRSGEPTARRLLAKDLLPAVMEASPDANPSVVATITSMLSVGGAALADAFSLMCQFSGPVLDFMHPDTLWHAVWENVLSPSWPVQKRALHLLREGLLAQDATVDALPEHWAVFILLFETLSEGGHLLVELWPQHAALFVPHSAPGAPLATTSIVPSLHDPIPLRWLSRVLIAGFSVDGVSLRRRMLAPFLSLSADNGLGRGSGTRATPKTKAPRAAIAGVEGPVVGCLVDAEFVAKELVGVLDDGPLLRHSTDILDVTLVSTYYANYANSLPSAAVPHFFNTLLPALSAVTNSRTFALILAGISTCSPPLPAFDAACHAHITDVITSTFRALQGPHSETKLLGFLLAVLRLSAPGDLPLTTVASTLSAFPRRCYMASAPPLYTAPWAVFAAEAASVRSAAASFLAAHPPAAVVAAVERCCTPDVMWAEGRPGDAISPSTLSLLVAMLPADGIRGALAAVEPTLAGLGSQPYMDAAAATRTLDLFGGLVEAARDVPEVADAIAASMARVGAAFFSYLQARVLSAAALSTTPPTLQPLSTGQAMELVVGLAAVLPAASRGPLITTARSFLDAGLEALAPRDTHTVATMLRGALGLLLISVSLPCLGPTLPPDTLPALITALLAFEFRHPPGAADPALPAYANPDLAGADVHADIVMDHDRSRDGILDDRQAVRWGNLRSRAHQWRWGALSACMVLGVPPGLASTALEAALDAVDISDVHGLEDVLVCVREAAAVVLGGGELDAEAAGEVAHQVFTTPSRFDVDCNPPPGVRKTVATLLTHRPLLVVAAALPHAVDAINSWVSAHAMPPFYDTRALVEEVCKVVPALLHAGDVDVAIGLLPVLLHVTSMEEELGVGNVPKNGTPLPEFRLRILAMLEEAPCPPAFTQAVVEAAMDAPPPSPLDLGGSDACNVWVRRWMVAAVMVRHVEEECVEGVLAALQPSFTSATNTQVRAVMDMTIMALSRRFPTPVLGGFINDVLLDRASPRFTVHSYIAVAAQGLLWITRHRPDLPGAEELCRHLATALLPWTTFAFGTGRVLAQVGLMFAADLVGARAGGDQATGAAALGVDPAMLAFFSSNSCSTRTVRRMRPAFDEFDAGRSCTVEGMMGMAWTPFGCDLLAVSHTEQLAEVITDCLTEYRRTMSVDYGEDKVGKPKVGIMDEERLASLRALAVLSVQRKRAPWESIAWGGERAEEDLMTTTAVDAALGAVLDGVDGRGRPCQPLVVMASFVDKAPNLGGLARTCEVFRAQTLTVANTDVVKDPVFKTLSTSAHAWMDVTEVGVRGIMGYLRDMKAEGYTVVGLEQAEGSVPLQDAALPDKVVLVLGREKEGVPVEIIQALDVCIEIPQFGVVRSLNVHVSASMVVWHYTQTRLRRVAARLV